MFESAWGNAWGSSGSGSGDINIICPIDVEILPEPIINTVIVNNQKPIRANIDNSNYIKVTVKEE